MWDRFWAAGAALIVCLAFAGPARGEIVSDWRAQSVRPASTRNMLVYVEDQYGVLTENAEVVIRDRASYIQIATLHTNADGYAQIELDTETWYIVQVYYHDHGTREFWSYDYIQDTDWWSIYPYGIKVLRRDDPWIERVTVPDEPLSAGESTSMSAELDHHHLQTNFDLWCRVTCYVDDDGIEPYLVEQQSDPQIISDGFVPYAFDPTLTDSGEYQVRFVLERKFELNDWETSDDTGWSWTVTVAQETADLRGIVFLDMNGNAAHELGETPAGGVMVEARNASGALVAQATTDSQGLVTFADLPLGAYDLELVDVPKGAGRPHESYPATVNGAGSDILPLPLDPWRIDVPMVARP